MMPAMDGFPLIDLVLKADPSMAVVAFTGAPSVDPAGSRLLFEKNVEMLHKPFPSDALVAALQRALANRKA
jgi:DNA-binding NtrC family response regulator